MTYIQVVLKFKMHVYKDIIIYLNIPIRQLLYHYT